MSNKQRYSNAFEITIKRYRDPVGKRFLNTQFCSMCKVTKLISHNSYECYPCPMSIKNGWSGCHKFRTYKIVEKALGSNWPREVTGEILTPKLIEAFNKRAEGLEKILAIIEEWPAEWFTIKGCSKAKHISWNL